MHCGERERQLLSDDPGMPLRDHNDAPEREPPDECRWTRKPTGSTAVPNARGVDVRARPGVGSTAKHPSWRLGEGQCMAVSGLVRLADPSGRR